MMAIAQAARVLSLETPLGKDVLLLERCTVAEEVSHLFTMDLDVLLDKEQNRSRSISPKDLIAAKVTVTLGSGDGERYFNGIVRSFTQGPEERRFAHYRLEVVPAAWRLTLKTDCRIFEKMAVPDIVQELLRAVDQPVRVLTNDEHPVRDHCVQYRESDFHFMSRLLEEEGIFYFFEHGKNEHTLVLSDAPTAFKDCPGQPKVRFEAQGGYAEREHTMLAFTRRYQLVPGSYRLRDHHFELPSKTLERTDQTSKKVGGNERLEVYDFPGRYAAPFNEPEERVGKVEPCGEKVVRWRMQEEEVEHLICSGTSGCGAFSPGYSFELTHHSEMNGKYTLLSVRHSMFQSPSYVSGEVAPEDNYQNNLTCIPYGTPFRPRRATPKPVVRGPQTAVVSAPKIVVTPPPESNLDKYGRVRVRFHWDRRAGNKKEEASCWARVAQAWAGGGWGAHFWPRVGQEVIVDFLEGDPDQPIVTGCVYNKAQMPPYPLPDGYTRSGIKTRSSTEGGSANYNELRFEDKKDKEQVFLNAERDLDLRVEQDAREYVGHDRHLIVKHDQVEAVEGSRHESVSGDHHEQVSGSRSLHVKGAAKDTVDGTRSIRSGADHRESVQGNMSLQVSGKRDETVGTVYAVESGQLIHLKANASIVIEAPAQICLKGSGGFVTVGPDGVTIQGVLVKINSGGAPGSGPGASPAGPEAPAAPQKPDTADDGSKFGKCNS